MNTFDIAFAATVGFWLCFFLLIGLPVLWFARDSWWVWRRTKMASPWQRRRARQQWNVRQEQIIALLLILCAPSAFAWLISQHPR